MHAVLRLPFMIGIFPDNSFRFCWTEVAIRLTSRCGYLQSRSASERMIYDTRAAIRVLLEEA